MDARRNRAASLDARRPFPELSHETIARGDLLDGDELIRLVGLLDAPRAANHRGHAGGSVLASFGAIGDTVRVASCAEPPSKLLGNASRARIERGSARDHTRLDVQDVEAISEGFAQARVDARAGILQQQVGIVARTEADLPAQVRFTRDDISCDAARHFPDAHRRSRRVHAVRSRPYAPGSADSVQFGHRLRRGTDRADPEMHEARMGGSTGDGGVDSEDTQETSGTLFECYTPGLRLRPRLSRAGRPPPPFGLRRTSAERRRAMRY